MFDAFFFFYYPRVTVIQLSRVNKNLLLKQIDKDLKQVTISSNVQSKLSWNHEAYASDFHGKSKEDNYNA